MSELPSEGYPDFAMVDTPGPIHGINNVLTPPAPYPDRGWEEFEKPPRNYFNWLHRVTSKWIRYRHTVSSNLSLSQDMNVSDPSTLLAISPGASVQVPLTMVTVGQKARDGGDLVEGQIYNRIRFDLTNDRVIVDNTDQSSTTIIPWFEMLIGGLPDASVNLGLSLTYPGGGLVTGGGSWQYWVNGNFQQILTKGEDAVSAGTSQSYEFYLNTLGGDPAVNIRIYSLQLRVHLVEI